jgi:parallel beta-helix repeat protein
MNINNNMKGSPMRPIWQTPTPQQPTIAVTTGLLTGAALANIGPRGLTSAYLDYANNLTQLGWYSVKDYGATGNGTTNDSTAVNATVTAAATGTVGSTAAGIYFPPGTYVLSATTFSCPVWFAAGAVISGTANQTFTGPINAQPVPVFTTTGTISINGATPMIYAEWFGAVGNGTTSDSLAINNALGAMTQGGILKLLAKAYKLTTTVTVAHHSTTIEGTSIGPSPYDGGGGLVYGTQLVGTNGVNGISITNLEYPVIKNLGIALPIGATTACVGILAASTFNLKIVDVRVTNYSTEVRLNSGNTDCFLERIYAASTGVTVTPVVGFDISSATSQNPSVYISHCITAHTTFSGSAYGFWVHGVAIADLFLDMCEADSCTYCYYIDGSSSTALLNMDIHMRGCIADSFPTGGLGFYVYNLASSGNGAALEIVNGWVSGGGTGSLGIYVAGSSARVRVSGMQVNGSTGLPIGIYAQNSTGCMITENTVLNCVNSGIVVDNSPCCTISNNSGYAYNNGNMGFFIQLLTGSTHCSIMGNVANGSAVGAITTGIATPAGCDYCNIIGNCIPSSVVTTTYSLALGSNTHSVQLGTTA